MKYLLVSICIVHAADTIQLFYVNFQMSTRVLSSPVTTMLLLMLFVTRPLQLIGFLICIRDFPCDCANHCLSIASRLGVGAACCDTHLRLVGSLPSLCTARAVSKQSWS